MSRGQRLVLLGLAAAIAVVAFFLLRPAEGEREPTERAGGSTDARGRRGGDDQPTPAPPKPEHTVVRVKGGKPVGGVQDVEAKSGDVVRLAIRSDRRDEVHIHGYDRYVQVGPELAGKARFRASLEGVYEIELHSDGTEIASLRVEP